MNFSKVITNWIIYQQGEFCLNLERTRNRLDCSPKIKITLIFLFLKPQRIYYNSSCFHTTCLLVVLYLIKIHITKVIQRIRTSFTLISSQITLQWAFSFFYQVENLGGDPELMGKKSYWRQNTSNPPSLYWKTSYKLLQLLERFQYIKWFFPVK